MHDKIVVGVSDGRTNFAEEHDAVVNRQLFPIAKRSYAFPFNILHRNEGQTVGRVAAIKQAGDIGVVE